MRLPSWVSWERICLQWGRPGFNPWVRKIPWRRDRLPTPVFLGFPGGSAGKESACNAGDLGSVPGLGRSPGEGKSYPLQYSGLENPMDCIVHGVTKSWTWLIDFHFSVYLLIRHSPYTPSPFPFAMTTGKTVAPTIWVFVGKVMSLLFNMLSKLVTVFFQGASIFSRLLHSIFPRSSKCLILVVLNPVKCENNIH